jgi:4'-phosphopantetheinyl transferase
MFLYIGQLDSPSTSHDLVRTCLIHYDKARGGDQSKRSFRDTPIGIGPHGKPYLIEFPNIHFSVSHTGSYWGCAIGESPLGFDLEEPEARFARNTKPQQQKRWEGIAKRFFAPEEYEWIKESGEEAFFRLWVLKEAYGKYKGTGITTDLLRISLVHKGSLLNKIEDAHFMTLETLPGLNVAFCGTKPVVIEDQVELKTLCL